MRSDFIFLPFQQDARRRHSSSPLGSTGSSNESLRTPEDLLNRSEEDDVDDTAAAFENGECSTDIRQGYMSEKRTVK